MTGHEVTFEMEADESPDVLPGDVTFKIISQPHHLFKRNGDDLSMVCVACGNGGERGAAGNPNTKHVGAACCCPATTTLFAA